MLPSTFALRPKLPDVGVTIFTTMSRLAIEHGAINLSQGFPDYDTAPDLVESVARAMREGHNQYAPMAGVPALREAIAGMARVYLAGGDAEQAVEKDAWNDRKTAGARA